MKMVSSKNHFSESIRAQFHTTYNASKIGKLETVAHDEINRGWNETTNMIKQHCNTPTTVATLTAANRACNHIWVVPPSFPFLIFPSRLARYGLETKKSRVFLDRY